MLFVAHDRMSRAHRRTSSPRATLALSLAVTSPDAFLQPLNPLAYLWPSVLFRRDPRQIGEIPGPHLADYYLLRRVARYIAS
jgi:hypothetical protein